MQVLYRFAADVIVVFHLGYATFIVAGLALILVGALRRWQWVRNFWFRMMHLLAILIVVAESWFGVTCPLTTWEKALRERAGQATYHGDFLANLAHELLFVEWGPLAFTVCYTLFGLAVLATLAFAPPRLPERVRISVPARTRTGGI